MTEEQKSFTVKDRRHFTSDGQTREPDAEERAQEAPAPPPTAQPKAPSPAKDKGVAGESPAPGTPVDFAQFVLSLGAQAGMLLGAPVEGVSAQEALSEARSLIGILEMLRDKTEGRRTPGEEEVLEGLLYELRMAYVARAREAGE
jgi:Domain of unknown function (DUF1844)